MMSLRSWTRVTLVALGVVIGACDDPDHLTAGDPAIDGEGPGASASGPGTVQPTTACRAGAGDIGLSGEALAKGRTNDAAGSNRTRLKPYAVLAAELQRVVGAAPASLAAAASTFGEVPARWNDEPKATALAIAALYDVSFDACLDYVAKQPELAAAPAAATAGRVCSTMMRTFWSRTPTPAQIDACASFAVTSTAKEPAPARRWAYVCASLLAADGFASY
jgi:hypothetical protein